MLFNKIFLVIALVSYHYIFSGFSADTLIKTQSTYTKIQDLKVGDHVACFDLVNKKIKFQPICCLKSHIEKNWVCITIDNKKIVAADNQKFYLPVEKRWKKAKKLKTDTVLLKHSAEQVQIQEISKLAMEIELFDISVVDEHNYFVSNNDILAHNFPPVVIGVTLAFGGGAIEFAGISAGIVTVAGVIGLKLRKKQQKSPTVQAQELSKNIGTSAHYYFDHDRYEVVSNAEIQESNVVPEIHSYKKQTNFSNSQTSIQSNTNNCLILPPEDPENDKEKNSTTNNEVYFQDKRPTNELLREIKSLQKQIEKHQTKLIEYIQNPDKYDNLNLLKKATTYQQRTDIINSRIRLLSGEINRFQQTINKAIYELNQRGIKWK